MAYFGAWFARKLAGKQASIREPRALSHEYRKALGGRNAYARVTLRIEPAEEFSYASHAAWPAHERAEDYEHAVQDGVIEELLMQEMPIISGVRVVLESASFHPVDSSPHAFYCAARAAMRAMLTGDGAESNIVWVTGAGRGDAAGGEDLPSMIAEMRKILNQPDVVPQGIYRRNVPAYAILSYVNQVSACLESRNWQAAMVFIARAAEELPRLRAEGGDLQPYLDLVERYLSVVATTLTRLGVREGHDRIPSHWIRMEDRPHG